MRCAFRISKRRHVDAAFLGEGAKLAGGRWNSPGAAAVYLSETLSLAALEVFVHLGVDAAAMEFVYFEVTIPDAITIARLERRPRDWAAEPPALASMNAGDRWLHDGHHALLEVPSVIVPTESNLLLNPAHPDARTLEISRPKPFRFDARTWKR